MHDAVFAAGLPAPILDAVKARRVPEFLGNIEMPEQGAPPFAKID